MAPAAAVRHCDGNGRALVPISVTVIVLGVETYSSVFANPLKFKSSSDEQSSPSLETMGGGGPGPALDLIRRAGLITVTSRCVPARY